MYKLKIPKVDFSMGPFPFPLCFDMTLALLLAYHGLDYRVCFSGCYAAEFHPEKSTLEELLVFPGYDRSKYERAGIVIEKQKVTCAQEIATILKTQLLQGSPVMLHFDGYDCPWDKNLFRRQHNEHTVLATGISRGGKVLKVCDLLFHKHQRTVWEKRVMRHCQFYYQIKVPNTLQYDAARSPRSCLRAFYQTLLRFIDNVEEQISLQPSCSAFCSAGGSAITFMVCIWISWQKTGVQRRKRFAKACMRRSMRGGIVCFICCSRMRSIATVPMK